MGPPHASRDGLYSVALAAECGTLRSSPHYAPNELQDVTPSHPPMVLKPMGGKNLILMLLANHRINCL
jgi:hypothetical protein